MGDLCGSGLGDKRKCSRLVDLSEPEQREFSSLVETCGTILTHLSMLPNETCLD